MAGDRSWGKQFPFKQLLTAVEWLPCNTVQCTLEQLHSREGEGGGVKAKFECSVRGADEARIYGAPPAAIDRLRTDEPNEVCGRQ